LAKKEFAKKINTAVFPGNQGGPLMHIIAAKAVGFKLAGEDDFFQYQKQVVKNSSYLAKKLADLGYRVVSGGTDTHLFLLDLSSKNITGKSASAVLGKVNITVNKNLIPFDTKPPAVASGVRIGTPAVTTRKMGEEEMGKIANLIDLALVNREDEIKLSEIKKEVLALTGEFPLYKELDL
jgi:glycine hydroxymethyltransferase